jgi:bacterioferritin-associated ferredoxin
MIVCICHRVSNHDIARAVRGGCSSFDELQFELSVATGCGACHDCARETFHEHAGLPSVPAAAPCHAAPAATPARLDFIARGRGAQAASA